MLKHHTRTLCILLGLLVIIGTVGGVLFWNVIKKSAEQAYAMEVQAHDAVAKRDQDALLKSMLETVGSDIQKFSTRIIEPKGTAQFLETIESLAREVGARASISNAVVKQSEAGESFEDLVIALSAEGSWDQVYTYLRVIEALPYKMSIVSGSLNNAVYEKASNEADKPAVRSTRWQLELSIQVLKRK